MRGPVGFDTIVAKIIGAQDPRVLFPKKSETVLRPGGI
jgi:hypothetical protein